MNEDYCSIAGGLPGELTFLTLDEVFDHLDNHQCNFLLDPAVTSCYVNRIAQDEGFASNTKAQNYIRYLCKKYIQIDPFNIIGLEAFSSLHGCFPDKNLYAYLKQQYNKGYWHRKLQRLLQNDSEQALDIFIRYLKNMPSNLIVADILLNLHLKEGMDPLPLKNLVQVPPEFHSAWLRRLFLTVASVKLVPEALEIWESLRGADPDEAILNRAAEIMALAGDRQQAIALYQASLAMDQRQHPVRRRLGELVSPTRPDTSLLGSSATNIYLYSFNKAALLDETLDSLARCDLGPAKIKVLLNGCTDDSLAVTQSAKERFPDNPVDIVALPINIGAPAARNWLIADPATRQADQTVFLDDDVLLQPDFLHHFLTAARLRPKCGVVGCKVLFPGRFPRFQYLYRNIAVAKPGILRISLDTPNTQYDNGAYDFARDTLNVMGCCHMFTRQALLDVPGFDLCFSPSQMDDIAHDLDLALLGYDVVYCGLVGCVHQQATGNIVSDARKAIRVGNVLGNDVKFYYRFQNRMDALYALGRDGDQAVSGQA
ncbi:MAG: glycosyltransferase [Solidesulfovibrio sp. DCME]|uniref:glycosyltransferase n=1 Tax=Solidesulfovibrio sp. DCME TaxID=3447380 RepID=UPI003D12F8E2